MGLFSHLQTRHRGVFAEREKQQKVWQFIRRLVDLNTPNAAADQISDRHWERYNRCLPIACVPIVTEELDTSSIFYGSTKDFSDNGVSLVTSELVTCGEVICGFWLDELKLLHGRVRHVEDFGGKLYEIGIEFMDVVESADILLVLQSQLRCLVPKSQSATT